jgi:DNA-binding beta-propeller fold protein YncE
VLGSNVTTLYGTGGQGHTDGDGLSAGFTRPHSAIIGRNNYIYIFDTFNNALRASGGARVQTVAGKSESVDEHGNRTGKYYNGNVNFALLNRPADGVVNSANELIFTDSGNNAIRVIRDNKVQTLSGAVAAGHVDGSALHARFNRPMAAAIDNFDNIYVADTMNHCIRKIERNGRTTTVAGVPGTEGYTDDFAKNALFRAPSGIAVSGDGRVIYVADTGNHIIRKIENGTVSTLAGHTRDTDEAGDPIGGYSVGTGLSAMFNLPMGLTLADNILIVADSGNHCIRAVSPTGVVTLVAGMGEPGDKDGPAVNAQFNAPRGVSYRQGVLVIADTDNNKIKSMPLNPAEHVRGYEPW